MNRTPESCVELVFDEDEPESRWDRLRKEKALEATAEEAILRTSANRAYIPPRQRADSLLPRKSAKKRR